MKAVSTSTSALLTRIPSAVIQSHKLRIPYSILSSSSSSLHLRLCSLLHHRAQIYRYSSSSSSSSCSTSTGIISAKPSESIADTTTATVTEDPLKPYLDQIDKIVHESDVAIFMKGTPASPQCGFSRASSQILSMFPIHIAAVDVLENPRIREAIKKYSSWPTLPQVFIKGEFIGGCDILMDMYKTGTLKTVLEEKGLLQQQATCPSTPNPK